MKRTYQPKKRTRNKVHGFRKRMASTAGRKVLKREETRAERSLPTKGQAPGRERPQYSFVNAAYSLLSALFKAGRRRETEAGETHGIFES